MPLPRGTQEIGLTSPGHLRDSFAGTNQTIDVATTAVLLLPSNAKRNGFLFVNNGVADLYLGFNDLVAAGSAADSHGGFLLRANGGTAGSSTSDCYAGPIYGICKTATVVAVGEW